MSRIAAITGGTGFLGRAVVLSLLQVGWQVRILAREPPTHPQLDASQFETIAGDLHTPDALRRLVAGADAVIHAAGLVAAARRHEFHRTNAEGTRHLIHALQGANPGCRLVSVSSLAAREPELSPYAASKKAAEELIANLCPDTDWVVVRPPAIYGPWDRALLPFFKALRYPITPMFGPRTARISLIHIDDAASAITQLCSSGPRKAVLELSDQRSGGYSWPELLGAAAQAMETKPVFVPFPGAVLLGAAAMAETWAFFRGKPGMLSLGKAREILHPDWSSQRPTPLGEIDWQPQIGLSRGLNQTVDWYRDMQWL